MAQVYFRPAPVRFHSGCKNFDIKFNRCSLKKMKVQSNELACSEFIIRIPDSYEKFMCKHCNRQGNSWTATFVRTEFQNDGNPVDIYKCEQCGGLTMLYQTEGTQHCRIYTELLT